MILSKFKRKALLGLAAGVAAVGLVASPALANTNPQAINALDSPNAYGTLSASISWTNSVAFTMNGRLLDNANDGHGPYLHVYGSNRTAAYGKFGACDIHNTSGGGTSKSVNSCQGIATSRLYSVSVWVCNGGDANGNGTDNGGCYGRAYFNPQVVNRDSVSLGTRATPYAYYETDV